MKKCILFFVIALIPMLMVVSCSKDDDSESNFEMLINYMDGNGMTIGDLLDGWIVSADSLHNAMGMYDVLDLRGGDKNVNDIVDFDEGHIEGSILTSLGTLLEDAAGTDKPIIVVCYTGQTAGHAVMALRLSGYMDARVLKWGMSGWHSDFDYWSGNTATLGHESWEVAPGVLASNETFDIPDLVATGDSGEEILTERIAAMLADGFKGINAVDDEETGVLDIPADYFINNFWEAEHVEQYGNIETAYRINPLILENLDPDETIVTYCWTGQTSSMVTAYLNILGYNAKSLQFGVNSIIYDDLEGHKWGGSADLDYVVTP